MIDEKKHAAEKFVERWTAAEGNEQREANSFWTQLLEEVIGINNPTRVLAFERKAQGRRIDIFYEDMGILIENKSRGVDLDTAYERGKDEGGDKRMVTPYEQAKWYADNLPRSISPRWIIICNFDTFRIHDLDLNNPKNDYVEVRLSELPQQYQLFSFFTDRKNSRLVKEQELSVKAGEIVGKLYQRLSSQYKNIETDEHEQKSLNVLIVRLVFLLYAEDADLLHERDAFLNYMRSIQTTSMRNAIIDLFKVLNTKPEERDPYLDEKLLSFPYINGGLFAQEDVLIPQFTEDIRLDLLLEASQKFNWSEISPTIFGAVFESTLNPETRRSGGMHYTSIENIHKVIDPLFLDDLKAELAVNEGERVAKNRRIKLLAFQKKLADLNIFDPACGSGNFLTESYLSLRKLENRILEDLQGDQMSLGFDGDVDPIQVHISQFYGIEINDFAVSVAKTALWIAEEQAMEATQEIILRPFDFLPLKTNANIREGNALRIDWNEVLPAEQCSYIIGNPPFISQGGPSDKGQRKSVGKSIEQSEDMKSIWGDVTGGGNIDYVSCWFRKATDYFQRNHGVKGALVSTNSICQGQQVEPIWKTLFDAGIKILFAHKSFLWGNEASGQAFVYVSIIGFSLEANKPRLLFEYENYKNELPVRTAENINGYLCNAPNVFVSKRTHPLCNVPEMAKGFQPTDNGCLLLDAAAYKKASNSDPAIEQWIRPFSMGEDFIKGAERYCLWITPINLQEALKHDFIRERISLCKDWRSNQSKTGDAYKLMEKPFAMRPCNKFRDETYIGVPSVTTARRDYVPCGFITNGMIPGNMLYFIQTDSIYCFGIMMSQFHNAWMRIVAGRFGPSYRYANTLVYNNFIWPDPTDEQHTTIETCAQAVLDARDNYPDKSLADLYDPDIMPCDLLAAHKALDRAVEAAYGVDFNGDEDKIVAHLFTLYSEAAS